MIIYNGCWKTTGMFNPYLYVLLSHHLDTDRYIYQYSTWTFIFNQVQYVCGKQSKYDNCFAYTHHIGKDNVSFQQIQQHIDIFFESLFSQRCLTLSSENNTGQLLDRGLLQTIAYVKTSHTHCCTSTWSFNGHNKMD